MPLEEDNKRSYNLRTSLVAALLTTEKPITLNIKYR